MQDEELRAGDRDYTILQSVDETACEPVAITRVRPVEQGCLKRPIGRKMGRQESVEELDKEKLKSKMVVKRQDWSERRESLQKQDALRDSDSSALCGDDRDDSFLVLGQSKTQSSPDSGPLEAKAASATLKDVLYKKLNTRVSEGITESSGSSSESEGGLRSSLCSIHPEWQHSRQGKDNMKPDRLDFKAPNIEFSRKRLSFEEREDCMCRLSSGLHENLHFGSTRSKSLQLDTAMSHDHMKAGLGTIHSSPEGLAPKLFSGRGESAVEKLQLISSAESPLRKTSSEYKLEGRHVSSLKPLEGTLDIGLLSGPRVSKTETCLSKMVENTSDTVSVSPPIWLQSPTERQITIPQLKTTDKLKSPLTCSPSPEAVCSLNSIVVSKESNHLATEVKSSTSGEKTQDRHNESLKPPTSKGEASTFTVKQESRTGMKNSSSLTHEHRAPRHSSHFSSCGKTPSIREVSNEDQEDEVEQQEIAPHTTSQNVDSCKTVVSLTSAKLELDIKTSPAQTQVETPATAANAPLPVSMKQNINSGLDKGQPLSCEKPATAQNSNMTSASKVNVQDNSASVHVPENVLLKQQLMNICSSNIITTSASGSVHENKTCSQKSKGQDCSERPASRDSVQSNRSAVKLLGDTGSPGSKKEMNTCATVEKVEQKRDVCTVNMATSLNNVTEMTPSVNTKKDNTVSAGAIVSSSMLAQKKEDPIISPKTKNKGNVTDSEQLSKHHPAEKAQHKSPDSANCTSKKQETVISVKENTVVATAKQKYSAPAITNENVLSLKSKSRPDPQPVPQTAVKTEKETKTLEVKSQSTAPPVPVVKGSPNSKQRDVSKESALSTPTIQVTHDSKRKEATLLSTAVNVKQEESLHSSHTPAEVKQKETQPKSSVATSTLIVKENTDSKPKSLAPKTVPSSATLKPSVAPTPVIKQSFDAKHKDPSLKNQAPAVKYHHDSKPKVVASPFTAPLHQRQQLRKEPLLLSDVPSQPDPPPVLPKPAARKETYSPSGGSVSGRVSTCAPQEAVVKVSKEGPKCEAFKPDSRKSPDTRDTTPDKQVSSSRKEQAERKKKETVQEVTSAQKNTKRDTSRAAAPAVKESSDKDTGRCKQQKESPRSSSNKK